MARSGFFGSMAIEVFRCASSANAMAMFLSRTVSSEATRSSPPGPRIFVSAATSKVPAALMSASAASFGVVKVSWFCGEDSGGFACENKREEVSNVKAQERPTIDKLTKAFRASTFVFLGFILVSSFMTCLPPPSAATAARSHTGRAPRTAGSRCAAASATGTTTKRGASVTCAGRSAAIATTISTARR